MYSLDFPFAKRFASLKPVVFSVIGRKYLGQPTRGGAASGGDHENEAKKIYYRLSAGDHYHLASCYLLDKDTRSMRKDAAVQKGYKPCGYCSTADLAVVAVTAKGKNYHAPDCYHIGGSVTTVTWDDIERLGLLPCEICVGGGGWFG